MNRFVTRELNIQEAIYWNKALAGDYESGILFLESRRTDKAFNIRELPCSALTELFEEANAALETASAYSKEDIKNLVDEIDSHLKKK
jgi:hypothetical protein